MFFLVFVVIAIATYCLPGIVTWIKVTYPHLKLHDSPRWLTYAASLMPLIGLILPDIHISNATDTFQLHFVGGGFYAALLFEYFCQLFGKRWSPIKTWLALFAFVSALGVANELLEFTASYSGLFPMDLSDTSWDLVANTSGALVGYAILRLIRVSRTA